MSPSIVVLATTLLAHAGAPVRAPATPPLGRPDAIVDLATPAGAALVGATWRYHDAELVTIDGRAPGPDLKPSGARLRTRDVAPHAEVAGFDDARWPAIDLAASPGALPPLEGRRGTGRVSFAWYRVKVTVPPRFAELDATGATIALETVLDDYAEVWVDGQLPIALGQPGGNVVAGFGAPNRVILTRDARPGQTFEVAIFAMNGPVSASPKNFIWVKSATLDVYRRPAVGVPDEGASIERRSPALDALVPRGARVEKLADGFLFTEGPVWHPDGYLLFSDPNANVIYRWTPDGSLSVFRTKSGYRALDVGAYGQPGSNGLALDPQGRLTIDEHGNRRVTRVEKNGVLTVLADRYDERRLNSPNDLVYRSDGALYFTDPPFGLPQFFDDPRKELPYSGVYCVTNGQVKLVAKELSGPNGLAFSPDERYLYVDNWDLARKVILRYEVSPDGSLHDPFVFADLTAVRGEQAFDGLKVDERGDVYAAGPGGLLVFSPRGEHLGTIRLSEQPANFAWGDADRRTLYVTARTGLYRVRLSVAGAGVRP
ncbi:MAG TPA: SMP-30/gluconolactonase/LRE family protein [Polyangia bacterium]|nr:SMP-30/gluconolactonase/LRE family protein [Polyangia bacterium]